MDRHIKYDVSELSPANENDFPHNCSCEEDVGAVSAGESFFSSHPPVAVVESDVVQIIDKEETEKAVVDQRLKMTT